MSAGLLELTGLRRSFGGVRALDGVELTVEAGELTSIIGPNGAGKTTLLDLISGFRRPDAGRVDFLGRPLVGLPPHRIAALGVVRTFQETRLLEEASVLDQLRVGALGHGGPGAGILPGMLAGAARRREEARIARAAEEALERIDGASLASRRVGELPQVDRKRVAIGVALAAGPRLLLLDEPTAGAGVEGARTIAGLLRRVVREGTAVLLVEHRVPLVLELSDRVVVLDRGRVLADGPPARVAADPAVRVAYLGERDREEPSDA